MWGYSFSDNTNFNDNSIEEIKACEVDQTSKIIIQIAESPMTIMTLNSSNGTLVNSYVI